MECPCLEQSLGDGVNALNLALLQALVAGICFSSFCKDSEDSAFELIPMATALGDN